jgi:hypothetical protein
MSISHTAPRHAALRTKICSEVGKKAVIKTVGLAGGLSLLLAQTGYAADKRLAEFDFLRVQASISAVAGPDIEEDSSPSGGSNTNYEWEGLRESGYQATVGAYFGHGHSGESAWQWGPELVFSSFDITPQSFLVNGSGGGTPKNGSTADLYYRTYGVNLAGGWVYGLTNINEFTGFIEIMPSIGGGLATADNEVYDGTNYVKGSGTGGYIELGLRAAAYITERRFIYGFQVMYQYSRAKVDIEYTGYNSELEINRHGFGIGGVFGYRF